MGFNNLRRICEESWCCWFSLTSWSVLHAAVNVPVLRKDWILHPLQVCYAVAETFAITWYENVTKVCFTTFCFWIVSCTIFSRCKLWSGFLQSIWARRRALESWLWLQWILSHMDAYIVCTRGGKRVANWYQKFHLVFVWVADSWDMWGRC